MDVRLSPEQKALRESAVRLADALGPGSVSGLDDVQRAARLDAAIGAAGWRELRADGGHDQPLGSAVDVALIAQELGRCLADAAFIGPTLAAELRRLAGAPPATAPETVALSAGLRGLAATSDGGAPVAVTAIDAAGCQTALVLAGQPAGYRLARVQVAEATGGADLTRPVARVSTAGATLVEDQRRPLTPGQLARWSALAVSLTCADLVGIMQGAVQLACEYARIRRQFGVPIGSFQAVQHALADAFAAAEGSHSVALHAAWAADSAAARDASIAAAIAKAYCSRAARSVCETAIQVHGGTGQTWGCAAQLYLRRALISSQVLGGSGPSLAQVLSHYGIGGTGDGLR